MSQEEVRAGQRRRRRDARRRILDSARSLLEERPWHAISLETIMTRAQLTRTTFYRHFDDRELLLLALLQEVGVHLDAAGEPWKRGASEPADELRRNLQTLTQLFVDHGRLLQAIADAAAHDSEVRRAYLALADDLVATTAARIAAEVHAGRSPVRDAEEVAAALVWMNERYLLRCFGGRPFTAEPAAAAAALAEIWVATIYGS